MRRLLFLLVVLFFTLQLNSQLVQKIDRKKYFEASYKMENSDFYGAIKIYEELISAYPKFYELYTDIGYCYLHTSDRQKSIKYLEIAKNYYQSEKKLNKANAVETMYLLGEAYYLTYDFENAKKIFQDLKKYSNKKQKVVLDIKIKQCDFSKTQFENPHGFMVYQPSVINAKFPNYCPVVTADQSKLFFTSRRDGSSDSRKDDDGYCREDIYMSNIEDGSYTEPVNIGLPVNTDEHEATCSISPDGTELFIFKSSIKDKGDIYYSKFENGKWTDPVKMNAPVNSDGLESHAALSPNGKYLYFTSDRKGGFGGKDIYVVEKDSNGNWTNAKNLGKKINTKDDEESPFLTFDGRFMYFSSKGLPGLGGYDIFISELQQDGSWAEPRNLGFPLNTVDDDVFFVPTPDPTVAYYSSKQNGDALIFVVQIYENQDEIIFVKGYTFDSYRNEFATNNVKADSVFVNGKWVLRNRTIFYTTNDTMHITEFKVDKFVDSVCKIPANTKIFVYDIKDNKLLDSYKPIEHKGLYGFSINPKSESLIYYNSPNHLYDILHVTDSATVVNYNAELDTIIIGKVQKIRESEYMPEFAELTDYQKKEFDVLGDFLVANPDLYVDVSSFGYNEQPESFDQQRTDEIVNILTSKGVNPDRIYNNLSTNNISGDLVEYTIYDSVTLKNVLDNRKDLTDSLAELQFNLLASDISFDINKYDNPLYYNNLDFVAKYLKDNPKAKIGVYGYTDQQGNPEYNKRLSEKRAKFVKDYLVNKGANSNQIVAEGRGFSKQISVNTDQNGQYIWSSLGYNRRVEIVVLEQGENSKLNIKPVQVPNDYIVKSTVRNFNYSVMVTYSKNRIPLSNFGFSVVEFLGVDGNYYYSYGNFDDEAQAKEFLSKIKSKYPLATVYLNNNRK